MEHQKLKIQVDAQLKKLLQQEDLDHDLRITKDDPGPKRFLLQDVNGHEVLVEGHYPLSNLLQILAYKHHQQQTTCDIEISNLYRPPLEQLNDQIMNVHWAALTRHFSEKGICALLEDSKSETDKHFRLYVSQKDKEAFECFSQLSQRHPYLKLKVVHLSGKLSDLDCVRINRQPGLLALSLHADPKHQNPFVVPGGRFNELYGWDSYFIIEGLLLSNQVDLAISMLKHLLYQIEYYGHILNANRSYYLQRSQPPLLTSIILLLAPHLSKEVLQKALGWVIYEYFHVWLNPQRCPEKTLSRYYGSGFKEPVEVEQNHFDGIYSFYAKKKSMSSKAYREAYLKGELEEPELDAYFVHDRSMRESGHDTTYRLINKSAHLYPVCLNSLLYKYEQDIGHLIKTSFNNHFQDLDGQIQTSENWQERAANRKQLVDTLLWNENDQRYYDYDFVQNGPHMFDSATSFYPLFAKLADQYQADALLKHSLALFEEAGGLSSTTKQSRDAYSQKGAQRQWDYPFGWAPHQMIFWKGALNYGYESIAQRLAYKWLYMVMTEARDYNGMISEKYDVVHQSSRRLAEYGNEGTDFGLYPNGGFGWTNASFLLGQTLLSDSQLNSLKNQESPSMLFRA